MKIVGCDLHARQQSIAMVDSESGEFLEKTLLHKGSAVRDFYDAVGSLTDYKGKRAQQRLIDKTSTNGESEAHHRGMRQRAKDRQPALSGQPCGERIVHEDVLQLGFERAAGCHHGAVSLTWVIPPPAGASDSHYASWIGI